MSASRKLCLSLAACSVACLLTAACTSDIGSSFKGAFVGTPTPTPEMPERPKLAMPPANAPLPVPGQTAQTAAAWRPQTEQPQQTAAQDTKSNTSDSSWYSSIFGSSDSKKAQ